MLSFLRFRRGKRDQKRRRSTTSWSPALGDLNSIFASRFALVFVEDNSYPNSVYNNHQYRFEVHNDTSTSTLLASLSDPAFARGA